MTSHIMLSADNRFSKRYVRPYVDVVGMLVYTCAFNLDNVPLISEITQMILNISLSLNTLFLDSTFW